MAGAAKAAKEIEDVFVELMAISPVRVTLQCRVSASVAPTEFCPREPWAPALPAAKEIDVPSQQPVLVPSRQNIVKECSRLHALAVYREGSRLPEGKQEGPRLIDTFI